jgi:formate hydrogenlyase subunit 4
MQLYRVRVLCNLAEMSRILAIVLTLLVLALFFLGWPQIWSSTALIDALQRRGVSPVLITVLAIVALSCGAWLIVNAVALFWRRWR